MALMARSEMQGDVNLLGCYIIFGFHPSPALTPALFSSPPVNDALKKLTESLHINPAPVDDRARASRVSSRTHSQTSEFDLSTLAWDNKLHEVLSRGKRIVPSPQAVVPSVTPDEQQATPAPQGDLSIVAHALASTQNELSAERGAHARLESEKRELEVALAQLQERDAHHSKSLYHLMEKLTSLNAAGGASGVTSPAVKRRMLSDAAFIAPFGSPTTPSTVLSPPARHAVAPRGHAAPPSVSHFSSGADDPFSDADPYEESLILQAPPQARVHDDQSQRLAELQSELDRAQHTNASLVAKLEAATFQTAVLHRTSEAHQLLAAQQMVHRSDQARAAEDARAAESKRQHLEDLQKIQRTERQIAEIQKEQKEVPTHHDAHADDEWRDVSFVFLFSRATRLTGCIIAVCVPCVPHPAPCEVRRRSCRAGVRSGSSVGRGV